MAGKLSRDTRRPVPILVEIVNRAYVVQAATGNIVSARRIGTGHDPRRSQGNGMHLVGCVGIPDDQLPILRGRNKMPSVSRPMHGINFGKMALECSLPLDQLILRDRFVSLLGDSPN